MTAAAFWWAFTLAASLAQLARNAMQRDLIGALGAVGAAQVRFIFGLPFACLFLALVQGIGGEPLPGLTLAAYGWTALGAVTQIAATALMLAAMRAKSFVVVIAATKTEPAQIALFALLFFGERPTSALLGAIALATLGVWLMSGVQWKGFGAIALGLVSAAFFALAAIGFRQALVTVQGGSFVIRASFILTLGLATQTALALLYMGLFDRPRLRAMAGLWRPSLGAGFMGAFASQFWYIGFALAGAAPVRTLSLLEVPLAQVISARIFKERPSLREGLGAALIVVAALLLVSGAAG